MSLSPAPSVDNAPAAALRQLLEQRHSCRGFLPDPVDRAALTRALESAQRAASWCNSQAWQVSIVSGAATERLREVLLNAFDADSNSPDWPFPEAYLGIYAERRRECGFALYEAVGVARGDLPAYRRQMRENFRLFGAPHLAVLTSDAALGVYGAIDVGGYLQILLLALQAEGIAAIPQAALTLASPAVKAALGIDANRRMVCGISIGYEDRAHPANAFRTRRAPLEQAVQWIEE